MTKSRASFRWQILLLSAIAMLASILTGEGILRLVLHPGDYLSPSLQSDEILGLVIRPNSGGHDAWGYRNSTIPDSVAIVTIGDSQTYGWSVAKENSWPALLGKRAGKQVYNLSLGGYGPVHYDWLLEHRTVSLHPQTVIAGFYFGNDLYDAYTLVYSLEYWESLRRPGIPSEEIAIEPRHLLGIQREWLSTHSVLYRLLVRFIADNFAALKMRYFYSKDADVIILEDTTRNVKTGLTPFTWFKALDLGDLRITEGLRLSETAFARMDSLCKTHEIRFVVLLIPTKESVYSPCISEGSISHHADTLTQMLDAEQQVRDSLTAFFKAHEITYLDLLPSLQAQIGRPDLYPADQDGHPRKAGCRVIAETIDREFFSGEIP
jgi:lysophospholipase L1-like esterase